MKLKLLFGLGFLFYLTLSTYSQSCPANWGMSTLKMVKLNTTDIDIICNENPKEGKVIREAATSSSSKGSGNGYQWEKKGGKLVVMWDKTKFSDGKFAKIFKRLFGK